MSLSQLLRLLRREFPRMRFYQNKLWNKDVIRSNYGDNKFLTVRIIPDNQFRVDTVDLAKYGTHSITNSVEALMKNIKDLVRVSDPYLVGVNMNENDISKVLNGGKNK